MSTALATQPRTLSAALAPYAPKLIQAATTHGDAHRYVQRQLVLAGVAAQKNPELAKCDPASVAVALVRVCTAGLEVGTTAHLVPFGRECTFIADWKGLVQLMLASGHVRDVYPEAVYERDGFRVSRGEHESLVHEPHYDKDGRGAIVAYYALARLAGGRYTFDVMSDDDVEAIRKAARSGNSPAWKNHRAEMGKKTVVRRLAKRMPQSPALRAALADADEPAEALPVSDEPAQHVAVPRFAPARPMPAGDLYAEAEPIDVGDAEEVDDTDPSPAAADAEYAAARPITDADRGNTQRSLLPEGAAVRRRDALREG